MITEGLAVAGERQALEEFERMAVREAGRLHGLSMAILRDPQDAEDAVQEVLLRAWRHQCRRGPPSSYTAWLTRVCVNHCISRRRRTQRWGTVLSSGRLLESAAEGSSTDPDLDRAYRALSRRQRAIVLLHYHYGYTLDECASLVGCRPGTARAHLHRALASLRQALS